jgi:hypothetical protein
MYPQLDILHMEVDGAEADSQFGGGVGELVAIETSRASPSAVV